MNTWNRFLRPIACGLVMASGLGACAETTAPLPPADEVLVVVNKTESSLSVVPVESPGSGFVIPLGGTTPTPATVAARGTIALVPTGTDDAVAVVDLAGRTVLRTIPLSPGSGATGVAIVSDTFAYVANPNLNTVTRVNYLTGDTASVDVGVFPQGVIFTRGRVFVLNGNMVSSSPAGPSWITVVDPVTNAIATGIDSIPLPGPGNARFADVGSDGLLYVISTGDSAGGQGRLSIVDPVGREEVANFGGIGTGPGALAADGGERLFISSFAEGLMEFNTVTRTLVRGEGDGVAIPTNSAVEVDSKGRVFAIEAGPCQGGTPGIAHVLRSNLTESNAIPLGECAIIATMTSIP